MKVDVVAIGAHPDDVEMIAGGTVAKLTALGRSVVIIDLTRGEMGTRGSPASRNEEAAAAAGILGVSERINLDLGDGRLADTRENRTILIEHLRRYRPALVLTHHWEDLHPDHCAAGELMKSIMYPLGFEKFPARGEPYRPNEVLFFMAHFPFLPSFIVDVTEHFETKMKAVGCFRSQLYDPASKERATGISQPEFTRILEARACYFGSQIHRSYGEPFLVRRPVPVDDPVALYEKYPKV
ncbi:bacillithiol biosynthesis deacetylase BshB1 [bacterium]|nr:bacillithiol biosynthesis deacetylase BshB1 [candidate division CSSED10-310 bacterium]